MFTKTRMLVGVLTTLSLGVPCARAQDTPAAVDRAFRAVRQDGAIVMAWAYPTVTFDQLGNCDWAERGSAYALTCRLNYTDGGARGSRVLSFQVNGRGFITAIADRGGTSFWPPFATMGLATIGLSAVAADELTTETDPDKRALLKLLANAPEPEVALAAIMNLRMLARS